MSWRRLRVLVVGAGIGGIAVAVRMLQDGHEVSVVDREDGVGGVWRANTYPGARCDVPSHLYSLSFAPKADWSTRYAGQPEILEYLERVTDEYGVRPHLLLSTEVTSARWEHEEQQWVVQLRGPDGLEVRHRVDVVIAATGQLSAPAVPDVKGLDDFAGPVFHSARWRHDVDLTGKRVAVIGTGASAVQFVPGIADEAGEVTVFQRSAPYLLAKSNRSYPGWEQRLYGRAPRLLSASRLRQYLWHEGLVLGFTRAPALMAVPTASWRLSLRRQVPDPDLREELTPDYTMGCKRVLRAADWYRTLTRPDVSLVTEGIDRVEPDGVRTEDGELHPADVVVLGTGFAATRFLTPMRVTGRDGADLDETWRDGAAAYLGTAVPGFPNFFLLYGPGTNLGHSSIIFMIESQIAWIRSALDLMTAQRLGWVDVRPDVASRYDTWFRSASARTVWESGCSSWYTTDGRNTNNWPGSTLAFRLRARKVRPTDVHAARLAPREPAPSRRRSEVGLDGS